MIDIVDRLKFDAVRCELQFSKGIAGNIEEAAKEIERLRSAFLAYLQNENECAKRGRLCGPGDTCGCKLEMEDYIDAVPADGQSARK